MKNGLKSTLTTTLIYFMGIMFLFSCETSETESSVTSTDSISETPRQKGESSLTSINFSDYTINKSYLDAVTPNFKLLIFQVEIHEGEYKLNAYYSKPGTGGSPDSPQKEYVRVPDTEIIKGNTISLNFPFSIGNNQILRKDLMGAPPHRYEKLQIIPIIENQILKFELYGIPTSLDKISLGNTNPSPPDTSFE